MKKNDIGKEGNICGAVSIVEFSSSTYFARLDACAQETKYMDIDLGLKFVIYKYMKDFDILSSRSI